MQAQYQVNVDMKPKLSVNLNAVAMLRNRRDLPWPNLIKIGRMALDAGAHGLTVHPRPDQRHIRFSDLPDLRALVYDDVGGAEFNIEGYPTEQFLQLVFANLPDQVTLVPDDPVQSTSDHGWDFVENSEFLKGAVGALKEKGCRVSLFCDPDASEGQIRAAADTGADRLELYTGPYGATFDSAKDARAEAAKLGTTADLALDLGLAINAGHDLTVGNLPDLLEVIPKLAEVSIGHAVTSEALEFGIEGATKRFLKACGY